MKISRKAHLIFISSSICIVLAISLFLLVPFINSTINNSSHFSKRNLEKANSHFNRSKIQEIIGNDTLPRKQKALMANNLGYQLLKKNRYGEAIEYFEFALEYDNTFIAAHHNLACALLKEDGNCRMYNAFHEILFELRLDPSRIEIISNDTDLVSLKLTKAYGVLHNGFPQNDSLLKTLIVGRWYKINKRAFEPDIHFGSNTKGTFSRINKAGKIDKTDFTYYVIDRTITINYTDEYGNQTKKQMLIDYDMERMVVIRNIDGFDSWSEFNECDK